MVEISSAFYDDSQELARTHINALTIDELNVNQGDEIQTSVIKLDGDVGRLVLRNLDISYGKNSETPFINVGLMEVNGALTKNVIQLVPDDRKVVEHAITWNVFSE